MIDRVRVSTAAADAAVALRSRFPELKPASIYKIAALRSLRFRGFLTGPPAGIDSDGNRPVRVSASFEIFKDGRPIQFQTIVQLAAGRRLGEEEVFEQVWYHIHLGVPALLRDAQQCASITDLFELLQGEIAVLPETLTRESPLVHDDIRLEIGTSPAGERVHWSFNDTSVTENPHIAIVGLSGQGKTQFALDILLQIRRFDPEITLTVLDYKGDLSEEGSRSAEFFSQDLGASLIRCGRQEIPVIPFVREAGEDPQHSALAKADLFGKLYSKLGTQQRLALRETLVDLFESKRFVSGFGFAALDEALQRKYEDKGRKPDGLIEVASKLAILGVFRESDDGTARQSLLGQNVVLRLNELTSDSLPVAFLTIDRLYSEMKRMPDAPRRGSVVSIRHVIFIDEAHHYLRVGGSPLAAIIREGRSKGVAVVLATQTISDLAGSAGSDYREFLSNAFFFKTNLTSASQLRALIPTRSAKAKEIADTIQELQVGKMIFTKHLAGAPRESIIDATQFYRR